MLFALVALVTGDVHADVPYTLPVYVTVTGTGSIRLLVASGDVVPCDSSSNMRLFDGRAEAGRTLFLQSPWPCVCEQHTYGSFRETNFTPPQVVCQQVNPVTGVPYPFVAIPVSTDG
jgi:hypothetical protein